MRRLLAVAAGALGLVLLPAAPASAAYTQAAWTSPEGVTAPQAGSDDWTATVDERTSPPTVTLAGVFDHPDGVAAVQLVLEAGEYPEGQPPCGPGGFGQQVPGAASGPTTFSFDVVLPCNGTYVIRAVAQSRGALTRAPETGVLRLALTVAAPAVPVQGLQAERTGTDDDPAVALSWEPVAEVDRDADFAGYDIERSVDGEDHEVIASLPDPAASSFVDEAPAASGGTHAYRVVSVRRAGAEEADGVVAAPDAAPSAEAEVGPSEGAEATGGDPAGEGGSTAIGANRPRGSATPRVIRRTTQSGGSSSRTVTTVDTGFGETLPFGEGEALPTGDASVVAELEDDGVDTRKQTLALVAGGGAMAVGALLVRRLVRKAAAPHEILQ